MSDEILGQQQAGNNRASQVRLLIIAVVAAGLIAFVVQNTDSTPVSWLVFEGTAPLWIVIVAAAVAGALLSELGGYVLRRRKRRQG